MRHLTDGTLRRLHDEPYLVPAKARQHYRSCARCKSRFDYISTEAQEAAALLAAPAPRVDSALAYNRLRQRLIHEDQAASMPRRWWFRRRFAMSTSMSGLAGRRFVKPVGGLAAALALVGALALTPLGTLAQSFITIFEPTQFAAVQVTPSDVQSMKELPDLNSYGTMTNVAQPKMSQATSAAAAQTATGLTIRVPSTLPAGVPSNVTYLTTTQGIATFTFSAAKASAAAAATHRTLPAMPSGVDGSTLRATIGPVVVAVYGGNTSYLNAGVALSGKRSAIAMARHAGRAASRSASVGEFPSLVIAQAPQPRVDSTGATVREIEDYLLQQPGISPSLASEIRAIGDPSSTLPIPIPISRATAQNVQVQGVSGLAIGDNTGIGSGVIWEKDGMVYGVVGTLTESQVLSIANSLH